ncbi:MAG: RDD family protein [Bacillota bacterium]
MNVETRGNVTVFTPEQVALQFRTAGAGSRAAAMMIDSLILLGANIVLGLLVALALYLTGRTLSGLEQYLLAVIIVAGFLVNGGYFIIMEYFRGGRTFGKGVLGLRVMQGNGSPLTFVSAVIRNLFRIIDIIPGSYLVGLISILAHPRNKRVGDMIANTVVVHDSSRELLSARKRMAASLSRWSGAQVEINLTDGQREAITAEDWRMLSAYIERLSQLSPPRAAELGKRMAGHFYDLMGIEKDKTSGNAGPQAFLVALYRQIRSEWEV